MKKYVLALDAGTSSSRAVLFNRKGEIHAFAQQELPQIYPQPGWVEHDPEMIWRTQHAVAQKVVQDAEVSPRDIAAIGITNQRETTILWERSTGKPIANAIVWQDRRTADICAQLSSQKENIRSRTGLMLDAYFSASKILWLLEKVPGARKKAEAGELCFGTVDTWLLWKLIGECVTDYTNASRTLLYNIHTLSWDEDLLNMFSVPSAILPEVFPSMHVYGSTEIFGDSIPVAGIAGDQQAALFGQTCFSPGMVKNTYGTGNFVLMNSGKSAIASSALVTTMACTSSIEPVYALEGSIFTTGAAVQWLRDELKIISSAEETETLALQVPDSGGVYVVPAFTGLGSPHWDMYARGSISGLTRGSSRAHLVRAVLESIVYQSEDVLSHMRKESGSSIEELRADGGGCKNDFLLQFQADISGIPVLRPEIIETTARGSAYLAGLVMGFWDSEEELQSASKTEKVFHPRMSDDERHHACRGWHRAVQRAKEWEIP